LRSNKSQTLAVTAAIREPAIMACRLTGILLNEKRLWLSPFIEVASERLNIILLLSLSTARLVFSVVQAASIPKGSP
jgi:hypothetical protein